ncbi:MAG: hypothetical protein KIT18_06215 [Burkholderiales bacterium]|nr:hypothetical protein [Burkholderiales bacterium]
MDTPSKSGSASRADEIKTISVRHESVAGFMADVYYRVDVRQARGEVPAERAAWLDAIDGYRREWEAFIAPGFRLDTTPINPQRAAHEIDRILPEDAILVSDIGVHHNWLIQFCKPKRPDSLIGSMGFGPMGFGVAGALGAKLAAPESLRRRGGRRCHVDARQRDRDRVRVPHSCGLRGLEQLCVCVDPRAAARLPRRTRTGDRLPRSWHECAL